LGILPDFIFVSMTRKSLGVVHHRLFHGSHMLPVDRREFPVYERPRDLQGLQTHIQLQVNSQANRLIGAERVLATTRKFGAVLLREMHCLARRTVLQGCPIEPMLLLLLFCGDSLHPVDFQNLAAKVPGLR
jgi:hypothetical protein